MWFNLSTQPLLAMIVPLDPRFLRDAESHRRTGTNFAFAGAKSPIDDRHGGTPDVSVDE
jgi:hypothetical protein